jgi:hypothetical protein
MYSLYFDFESIHSCLFTLVSPSRKMRRFFVIVAAHFLKKCNEICGIFMHFFYAMKLQKLQEHAKNSAFR